MLSLLFCLNTVTASECQDTSHYQTNAVQPILERSFPCFPPVLPLIAIPMSIPEAAGVSLEALESPTGSKRTCVIRPDEEWARIRARYETAERTLGLRALAKEYKIPISTLMKRAWREGWKQSQGLCLQARKIVEAATLTALESKAAIYGERAAESLLDQLQPLIEREKVNHTKQQILRSNGHLDRLDRFLKRKTPMEPRDEAHLAKAVSTHVLDLRRTLGMGDSGLASGSLSLRILTEGAAVELRSGPAVSE